MQKAAVAPFSCTKFLTHPEFLWVVRANKLRKQVHQLEKGGIITKTAKEGQTAVQLKIKATTNNTVMRECQVQKKVDGFWRDEKDPFKPWANYGWTYTRPAAKQGRPEEAEPPVQ